MIDPLPTNDASALSASSTDVYDDLGVSSTEQAVISGEPNK
jgi:hypothetical protein